MIGLQRHVPVRDAVPTAFVIHRPAERVYIHEPTFSNDRSFTDGS
jgi:hypothetical protein